MFKAISDISPWLKQDEVEKQVPPWLYRAVRRCKLELAILHHKGQCLPRPHWINRSRGGWLNSTASQPNAHKVEPTKLYFWRIVLRGLWYQTLIQLRIIRHTYKPAPGELEYYAAQKKVWDAKTEDERELAEQELVSVWYKYYGSQPDKVIFPLD